jgi:hypothetical protein
VSAVAAKAALRTRLLTLVPTHIRVVLNGRPNTAHNLPLIYMELRDGERVRTAQNTVNVYRIAVCALVAFQENIIAEDTLDVLVNVVAAAVDDNARYGAATSGRGQDWSADDFPIGEVIVRRLTWIVRIKDEGPSGSGI